jgi:prephenate dehydratase
MKDLTVSFQGEKGAYSELAAFEYFGGAITTLPCGSFEDIFVSVEQGRATHGLLPIENSLAGSIHRNYDLLLEHEQAIVGEYNLRVNHCLMALPGASLEDIQRAHSHPQALAQCRESLRRMGVQPVAQADTAGSARLVAEGSDPHQAALASSRAADVYGLHILVENMEDNPANYTRFLTIAREELSTFEMSAEDYKTSVVFSLHNQPGALFKALSVFALRDIDLTKIESRPIPGKPWEYMFYVDFAGLASSYVGGRALDHLDEVAAFVRVLGSYPRHRQNE